MIGVTVGGETGLIGVEVGGEAAATQLVIEVMVVV
jgi:hypothetical protein